MSGADGLLHRPATIRIHPHHRFIAIGFGHRGADGGYALDVVVKRLAALCDLDLKRATPGVTPHDLRHLLGCDGGDGGVDLDKLALRGGQANVCAFDGRAQPRGGLGCLVLQEGRELSPGNGAVDEERLASGDATEFHCHGQSHDVGAAEDVVDWRKLDVGRSGHRHTPHARDLYAGSHD